VSAGNPVYQAYSGAGKDCASNSFERPGFISNYTGRGVPGMSGGSRRKSRGGYVPAVAPLPGYFPDTTGVGGTVAHPGPSAPGVPAHAAVSPNPNTPADVGVKQTGGRYESNVGSPLDPVHAIGMSGYAPISSIDCERGTSNPLNPNPAGIQQLTTLPQRGGAAPPTVAVGAADSMRIYAPTAGYSHGFQTFNGPSSAVGGLMLNTPYDARAFNQACNKTGGGAVADGAAAYSSLDAKDITGRGGFDGSKGLLPMKYGGTRRKSRKQRKQRKSRKERK